MIHLRPATAADLPALIDLARRSWLGAFAGAPGAFVRDRLTRDFEREWYTRYWPTMTAAEVGGGVCGVVQPMADEVNGLWVGPEAQGHGVGTALLRHGEQEIARAGYARAWLGCSGFNPRAVRFYLARGYRHMRTETTERPGGIVEEMLYFERQLVDGGVG